MNGKSQEKPAIPHSPSDPLVETFKKFHSIYADQEDEQLVRLAAGVTKNLVKQILMKYLIGGSSKSDELFDDDRPLRHFSAMVHLAYRLGLISKGLAKELHVIRKMRKEFVDSIDCQSLDYKDAQALCERLNAPAQIRVKSLYIKEKFPDTPRGNFELTVTILSCLLEDILKNLSKTSKNPYH